MWDVIGDIFRPSACRPFWTGVSYHLATTTSADQRHATRATQSRGGSRRPCQGPLIKHERALPWAVVPVTDRDLGQLELSRRDRARDGCMARTSTSVILLAPANATSQLRAHPSAAEG